jgi:hypothetical protein
VCSLLLALFLGACYLLLALKLYDSIVVKTGYLTEVYLVPDRGLPPVVTTGAKPLSAHLTTPLLETLFVR